MCKNWDNLHFLTFATKISFLFDFCTDVLLKSTMTTIPTNHMIIFCRTVHRTLHSQSKFTLKTSETKSNCAKEYSTGKKLASKSWNWWWQQSQRYVRKYFVARLFSRIYVAATCVCVPRIFSSWFTMFWGFKRFIRCHL